MGLAPNGYGRSRQGAACGSPATGVVTWIGWLGWLGEEQGHEIHGWGDIWFEFGVNGLGNGRGLANVAIRVEVSLRLDIETIWALPSL